MCSSDSLTVDMTEKGNDDPSAEFNSLLNYLTISWWIHAPSLTLESPTVTSMLSARCFMIVNVHKQPREISPGIG